MDYKLLKHKCTNCSNEETFKLYECACYEDCQCPKTKCTNCGFMTVPKKSWINEQINSIEFDLYQLYEYDDDMKFKNSSNNKTINSIIKRLKSLEKAQLKL